MKRETDKARFSDNLARVAGALSVLLPKIKNLTDNVTSTRERLDTQESFGQLKAEVDGQLAALSRDVEAIRTQLDLSSWSLRRLENPVQLTIGAILGGAGLASLYLDVTWLSAAVVAGVDIFVLALLLEIAIRTGIRRPFCYELAHRAYFVFIFAFLLTGLVCSFGKLYLWSGSVYNHCEKLATAPDAAYFSAVTIMTLGYGDFVPTNATGRWLVLGELGSGALLLLLIVPVLASRLALRGAGHD